MPTWIIGPLAMLVVLWCARLAKIPSPDGKTFPPVAPARVLYPAGLVALPVVLVFGIIDLYSASGAARWNEYVAVAILAVSPPALIITWPPTIIVMEQGLFWRRLFVRRLLPWDEIEYAVLSVDGRVVIFLKSGEQYDAGLYIQGSMQLPSVIRHHLRQHQSKLKPHLHPSV